MTKMDKLKRAYAKPGHSLNNTHNLNTVIMNLNQINQTR